MNIVPNKRIAGLSRTDWRNLGTAMLFISPWIVGFTVFLAYPIVMSLYYSMCDFSVLQPPQFIGLENYRQLFADDVFRKALGNTVFYAVLAIPIGILVAVSLAMLLNTGVKGMPIYRTIFFLPSMVPAVALAILWMLIFNGTYGILNFALKQIPLGRWLLVAVYAAPVVFGWLSARMAPPEAKGVGLARGALLGALPLLFLLVAPALFGHAPSLQSLSGMKIDPPSWLDDKDWVKPAFVVMSLWGTGNAVVIYLAGLQDVPVHLYEASDLDGANWWQKTKHVTLPMISPVILFNGIMAIIGTFNYFAIPYIMAPGGKPARSAYFLAVNLYDNAFTYLRMGYASAMAWILFALVFVLTMLAMKLSARHVHYGES